MELRLVITIWESETDFDDTVFLFMEEDFAFSAPEDFLNVLPKTLVDRYSEFSGIEKLNRILGDKELLKIIDESQGSILNKYRKFYNRTYCYRHRS